MQHSPQVIKVPLQEANARAGAAARIVTGFSRAMPGVGDLWQQITHSLSDVPILTTELARLQAELVSARLDRANLAAAGRATMAAYRDGDPDPLFYLRDELAAQGFISRQEQA